MRFASLGSGSRGNALIVEAGGTKLLVDCGFSLRSAVSRLTRLSIAPEEITGILVTHEHSDHLAGVGRFASRFGVPVYLTHGTQIAAEGCSGFQAECVSIDSHSSLSIQNIQVLPFTVPHDAREPVQYLFDDGVSRLGVLTDCGTITPHIVDMLDGCDALVLECNHDRKMLADSAYPAMLKRRIAGGVRASGQRASRVAAENDQFRPLEAYRRGTFERTKQRPGACEEGCGGSSGV